MNECLISHSVFHLLVSIFLRRSLTETFIVEIPQENSSRKKEVLCYLILALHSFFVWFCVCFSSVTCWNSQIHQRDHREKLQVIAKERKEPTHTSLQQLKCLEKFLKKRNTTQSDGLYAELLWASTVMPYTWYSGEREEVEKFFEDGGGKKELTAPTQNSPIRVISPGILFFAIMHLSSKKHTTKKINTVYRIQQSITKEKKKYQSLSSIVMQNAIIALIQTGLFVEFVILNKIFNKFYDWKINPLFVILRLINPLQKSWSELCEQYIRVLTLLYYALGYKSHIKLRSFKKLES